MMAETVEEVRSTMAAAICKPAFVLVNSYLRAFVNAATQTATHPQHKP